MELFLVFRFRVHGQGESATGDEMIVNGPHVLVFAVLRFCLIEHVTGGAGEEQPKDSLCPADRSVKAPVGGLAGVPEEIKRYCGRDGSEDEQTHGDELLLIFIVTKRGLVEKIEREVIIALNIGQRGARDGMAEATHLCELRLLQDAVSPTAEASQCGSDQHFFRGLVFLSLNFNAYVY